MNEKQFLQTLAHLSSLLDIRDARIQRLEGEISQLQCALKDQRFDAAKELEDENIRLKSHVKSLASSHTVLKESIRAVRDELFSESQYGRNLDAVGKLNRIIEED